MVIDNDRSSVQRFRVLGSKVEETEDQYICYPDLQLNPEP